MRAIIGSDRLAVPGYMYSGDVLCNEVQRGAVQCDAVPVQFGACSGPHAVRSGATSACSVSVMQCKAVQWRLAVQCTRVAVMCAGGVVLGEGSGRPCVIMDACECRVRVQQG